MGVEETKQIIIAEIKNHLPWEQLNMATQITFSNHIRRTLENFEKDILNDKKAILEWVLRSL